MLRLRQMRCWQKFFTVRALVHNHFNQERHLYSRDNFKANRTAALAEWPWSAIGDCLPVPVGTCSHSSDSTMAPIGYDGVFAPSNTKRVLSSENPILCPETISREYR